MSNEQFRYHVVWTLGNCTPWVVYRTQTTGDAMEWINRRIQELGMRPEQYRWAMAPDYDARETEELIWKQTPTFRLAIHRNFNHPHYQKALS